MHEIENGFSCLLCRQNQTNDIFAIITISNLPFDKNRHFLGPDWRHWIACFVRCAKPNVFYLLFFCAECDTCECWWSWRPSGESIKRGSAEAFRRKTIFSFSSQLSIRFEMQTHVMKWAESKSSIGISIGCRMFSDETKSMMGPDETTSLRACVRNSPLSVRTWQIFVLLHLEQGIGDERSTVATKTIFIDWFWLFLDRLFSLARSQRIYAGRHAPPRHNIVCLCIWNIVYRAVDTGKKIRQKIESVAERLEFYIEN